MKRFNSSRSVRSSSGWRRSIRCRRPCHSSRISRRFITKLIRDVARPLPRRFAHLETHEVVGERDGQSSCITPLTGNRFGRRASEQRLRSSHAIALQSDRGIMISSASS